jgi:hypothetical protein
MSISAVRGVSGTAFPRAPLMRTCTGSKDMWPTLSPRQLFCSLRPHRVTRRCVRKRRKCRPSVDIRTSSHNLKQALAAGLRPGRLPAPPALAGVPAAPVGPGNHMHQDRVQHHLEPLAAEVDLSAPAAFPGQAQVCGEGPGGWSWAWQAMISQVQRSAAWGPRIFGTVQPRQREQPEGVFRVKPAQKRLPQAVHADWRGTGG